MSTRRPHPDDQGREQRIQGHAEAAERGDHHLGGRRDRADVARLTGENDALRAANAELAVRNDELSGASEPKVVPDGATPDECLAYLLDAASCWSPDARLVGNLRAGDIVRSLRDWRDRLDRLERDPAARGQG
ncbi:MAG: hypothetical protein JWO31_3116 [Phycisphaerales bacterium]|nr:hypothetical protein [Phycisphaerales bacterium]